MIRKLIKKRERERETEDIGGLARQFLGQYLLVLLSSLFQAPCIAHLLGTHTFRQNTQCDLKC